MSRFPCRDADEQENPQCSLRDRRSRNDREGEMDRDNRDVGMRLAGEASRLRRRMLVQALRRVELFVVWPCKYFSKSGKSGREGAAPNEPLHSGQGALLIRLNEYVVAGFSPRWPEQNAG